MSSSNFRKASARKECYQCYPELIEEYLFDLLKPSKSVLLLVDPKPSCKVDSVLKPTDEEILNSICSGKSLVVISTRPPLKLPGLSGVNVLIVTMF